MFRNKLFIRDCFVELHKVELSSIANRVGRNVYTVLLCYRIGLEKGKTQRSRGSG